MRSDTYDLGITEAAAVLGVHPDTVRTWADENKVPCWRTPSGHRRFRRADLLALLPSESTGGEAA